MARAKIDWTHHISRYESSDMTAAEYCLSAGIKLSSFQTNRYRLRQAQPETGQSGFEEVALGTELVSALAQNGELKLSGRTGQKAAVQDAHPAKLRDTGPFGADRGSEVLRPLAALSPKADL